MSNRTPDVQAAYNAYRQQLGKTCDFCKLVEAPSNQVLNTFTYFLRIVNRFPYITWDGKPVAEHQMIIPKRHVAALNELTPGEAQEFLQLITTYEHQGFSLYSRAPLDRTRTIAHQHTHLIKLA